MEIQGPSVQKVLSEFVTDAERAEGDHRGLKDPVYIRGEHAELDGLSQALSADRKVFETCGAASMRFVVNRPA